MKSDASEPTQEILGLDEKDLDQLFEVAMHLIDRSEAIILDHNASSREVTIKSDRSWVTATDYAIEDDARGYIEKHFPGHGVLGEELGSLNPDAAVQWILDPIDGTTNYVNGIPTYGTILGVHLHGRPILGIINHPALRLRYHALRGRGALCNGRPLHIPEVCNGLTSRDELVVTSTRAMFMRSGEEALFDLFNVQHPDTRIYYDCFGHTRAVSGQVGAMVEFNCKPWDFAASQLLVEEAGGVFEWVRQWSCPVTGPTVSAVFGKSEVVQAILPFFSCREKVQEMNLGSGIKADAIIAGYNLREPAPPPPARPGSGSTGA